MLLLVGLGNPTPNSQNNRHNIGFKIVDAINQKFGLSKQKPKFKGLLTTGNIGDKTPTDGDKAEGDKSKEEDKPSSDKK